MKVSATVRVEGLRELDRALAELPKATARNVLKRALTRRAQPMAETMRALAPDDPATGAPDLHTSIIVTSRARNRVGFAEYTEVMKAGGSKSEARGALIAARRADTGKSFAEVYVGPDQSQSYIGRFQEFGTKFHGPQPFMRPAWEQHKDGVLVGLRDDLWDEVQKAAARLAKKQARITG